MAKTGIYATKVYIDVDFPIPHNPLIKEILEGLLINDSSPWSIGKV